MTKADAATADLPAPLAALPIGDLLLPYQQRCNETIAANPVTLIEKSRRIGLTWGVASEAVLTAGKARAAGGMDVFYISYSYDMTREFIDTCAMWSKALMNAAVAVDEFLFKDQSEGGEEKDIQAFRIRFASGFEIVALSSQPRGLRGKQGFVIFDEAAFHDDLPELMKAAGAFLIWGGRVVVISTHNGADNPFAEMVDDVRAGRRERTALIRITFDDAIKEGLYQRICLVSGQPWSKERQAEWVAEIRASYGDDAAEELDVVPAQGGGRFLALTVITQNVEAEIPVIRWAQKPGWAAEPREDRVAAAQAFCDDSLRPLLEAIPKSVRSVFGMDFARKVDLSVVWPLTIDHRRKLNPPFVLELRCIPFEQQEQILFFCLRRLPRFSAGAMDASGNGAALAEKTQQEFGFNRIQAIQFSTDWYRSNMPLWKAALEDRRFAVPEDRDIVDDFRIVTLVNGVARVPEQRTKGADGGQRHGDAAIAAALAEYASRADPWEADFIPIAPTHPLLDRADGDDEVARRWSAGRGF